MSESKRRGKVPRDAEGERLAYVLGRTFPLESLREITAIPYITPFNRHSYYRKEATGRSLGTNISEATLFTSNLYRQGESVLHT
jgi:hypothetical protein